MPSASKPYLIRSPKQLAALRAPTRQEIVDVLASMGTVSVTELAAALSRPADALYYHLRILVAAGLVVEADERGTAGRRETLYRTVAPTMSLVYEPGKRGNDRHITPLIGAMLRLTERDVAEGLRDPQTVVEGEARELWATRRTGWLSAPQIAAVNRYIARLLQTTLKSPPSDGRLFGLTVVLTPLGHRARKQAPKAPARKRAKPKTP